MNVYYIKKQKEKKWRSMKFPGNERQVFLYLESDLNNQGKVRDFWHTTYISSAYLPRRRNTHT